MSHALELVIRGTDLPGRTCTCRDGPYTNVHVGVQERKAVVDLRPGDACSVEWTLALELVRTESGADFRGPFAQGKKGDRFVYLSWGSLDARGTFAMFRRAKLMLAEVEPATLASAMEPGARLVAELRLTLPDGTPICAAVRPPRVRWSSEPATT